MLKSTLITHYTTPLREHLHVDDPAWKAWRIMKDCDVKHLPVKKENKIVGVVSDKDIVQISGFNGGQSTAIKEAMSLDPLIIPKNSTLAHALNSMLAKDQMVAIVVDENNLVCGIFSWVAAFNSFLQLAEMSVFKKVSS